MAKILKLGNDLKNVIIDLIKIAIPNELKNTILNLLDNNNYSKNYNLITDGPAIKTGRKIDNYDEYVQRISFVGISSAGLYKKDFDCTNKTIIKFEASAWAVGTCNWFTISIRHDYYNNMVNIDAADVAIWCSKTEKKLCCRAYNGNLTRVFVNVYYIVKKQS